MANKKFVRIVAVLLAALMLFGVIEIIIAGSRANAVTQAEIDALQAKRDAIREQQADLKEQIDAIESEMASVMEQKAALDHQNELNRQDIEIINEQIALYDRMIEEKSREVDEAIANEQAQFEHYCARVRTMEETNEWSYVSVLLNASSLSDFLSRLNDIFDIVENDQHIKDEYIAAREFVQQVKAEYERIQAEQREKREELLEEKERLEKQIEAAYTIIAQLEDDIEKFKSAYEENEARESEVQAKIDEKVAELQKQKEAEEAARKAYEESLKNKWNSNTTVASGSYYWPVQSCTYITSKFGYRVHPIFGYTKYHSGVDIAAGAGSTISAAMGGTVSISEYSDSYGYYCVIYHSNGTTTLYAHMNAMPSVSVGDTVSQGQTIGYVGSTGWSTGPHCHFEIRVNGSCVDPISYFPGVGFSYSSDA